MLTKAVLHGVISAGDGFNIWRGVRRPDGADEREM
jgi:hypothetical protein